MVFFQSLGIVALFNDISISLVRKGVMASQPNFRISPETPSGLTDLFLPIFANLFLIILVLIINVSPEMLIVFSECYDLMYMEQNVKVRLDRGETRSMQTGRGVKQGCSLSPILFNL